MSPFLKLICIFISILLCSGCYLTETIRGQVLDAKDRTPIHNAKIILEIQDKDHKTVTLFLRIDQNGKFAISRKLFFRKYSNPFGYRQFILKIDAEGYKHQEVKAHGIGFKNYLYYPRDEQGNIFLLILMEKE